MTDWRKSREYRVWRAEVIRRDGRCQMPGCNSIKSRHAHHVKGAQYFPEIRFDPKNGICFCDKCHTQFHTNFKRSFREKCDEKDLANFITLVNYIRNLSKPQLLAGPTLAIVDANGNLVATVANPAT